MHRSRAYRRHQSQRMKSRARKILRTWSDTIRFDLDQRRVGMRATTPSPCSCWMCGNLRWCGGGETLSRQERRANFEKDWR